MKNLFYIDVFPDSFKKLENLAHSLGVRYITGTEIWERARLYEEPPHFSNLYMEIIFSDLAQEIQDRYGIECDY